MHASEYLQLKRKRDHWTPSPFPNAYFVISLHVPGRTATFFFNSVLLRSTFLKAMLLTTSNIIQALQYKHFDKRLVIYISSLLPSVFYIVILPIFKLSLTSSILKRLRVDTTVNFYHPLFAPSFRRKGSPFLFVFQVDFESKLLFIYSIVTWKNSRQWVAMVTRYNVIIDIWGRDISTKMRQFEFLCLERWRTTLKKKSKLLAHNKSENAKLANVNHSIRRKSKVFARFVDLEIS